MTRMVYNRDGGKTDEYGHVQAINRLFTGQVITGFTVEQASSPNMTVKVNEGVGLIPTGSGWSAYAYHVGSDAAETVTITPADGSNPRYDLIVAYVDKGVTPNTGVTNNTNNMFKIVAVAGTPAASPADPSGSAIQTAIGASNPYMILARVRVPAGDTIITTDQVDDLRTMASLNVPSSGADGWLTADPVTYGSNDGMKQYTVTTPGDKTAKYSPGMRMKFTRGTAAPTQCFDFELSSSQYANKTSPSGITFTDDFTVEAWIKLESYNFTDYMNILGRRNGTSGWGLGLGLYGQPDLFAFNSSGANVDRITSYQSLPLGVWCHVAATLDTSGNTGSIYINGQLVESRYAVTGSGLSSITQAGDLLMGASHVPNEYYDGQLADLRIWNVIRTQQNVRDNMNKQLVGNETNLVGYFKGSGNFTDSTSNANNMTAQNSAIATFADHPMRTTEYAIITNASFASSTTTITLFTGNDNNIPNMTLSAASYSTNRAPYGFPNDFTRFRIEKIFLQQVAMSVTSLNLWIDPQTHKINVPIGRWLLGYESNFEQSNSAAGAASLRVNLSESTSVLDTRMTTTVYGNFTGGTGMATSTTRNKPITLSAPNTYSLMFNSGAGNGTVVMYYNTASTQTILYAECAYF